jgi:hypothetical protein
MWWQPICSTRRAEVGVFLLSRMDHGPDAARTLTVASLVVLHQELSQAGIPLGTYSPEDQVLAEADYALSPQQHEGAPISYGFISVCRSLALPGCLVVPPGQMTAGTGATPASGRARLRTHPATMR